MPTYCSRCLRGGAGRKFHARIVAIEEQRACRRIVDYVGRSAPTSVDKSPGRIHVRTSIAVTAWCLLISSVASAQDESASRRSAEVALSNDTLELRYQGNADVREVPRSRITAGFLLTEDRDIVIDGGLLVPANLRLGPLSAQFGPRAYAALLDEENNDILSLSVGAEVRFDISRNRGLAVTGKAYYAPDILTFGTADNLTDLSARAEIRLSSDLLAFAGMRWFELDLTEGGGESTLMEEVFVGVGWQF
jgi:hypothetical protein